MRRSRFVGDPRLAPLFGPESSPEVDIVATLENGAVVSGRIDRLAETTTEALIAEFKTGRPRGKLEDAHLRQLALYRAAIAPLFPGKRLRCFLIYTQNASVLEAEEMALAEALACALTRAPAEVKPAHRVRRDVSRNPAATG